MLNIQRLIIDSFVESLQSAYQQSYGILKPEYSSIIAWAGQLALENMANSDSLYHNVDHTMMVSLVGQEILKGKQLNEGGVKPLDWLHFMIALLCHDIGYLRGICRDDKEGVYATGVDGKTVKVSLEGTDAAMTLYHVNRSKLFVRERFGDTLISDFDSEVVTSYIEMTRFPVPDDAFHKDTAGYPGLVRAADFIGQLGDPNYLRKIPALFYEFEETGTNAKIGYKSPGDMRRGYPKFFWNVVTPYIQDALPYLRVTQEGKQWIANLHANVFAVEHL